MQNGKQQQLGFTYIGLLVVVAISGIGLAGSGIVWHHEAQREREKELLFIGDAYRKAIGSYYESSPITNRQFPSTLDELILDKRFPVVKRHLRKLYANPFSLVDKDKADKKNRNWGLILQQNKIIGIYPLTDQTSIKKTGFKAEDGTFGETNKYNSWQFIYLPGTSPIKPIATQ